PKYRMPCLSPSRNRARTKALPRGRLTSAAGLRRRGSADQDRHRPFARDEAVLVGEPRLAAGVEGVLRGRHAGVGEDAPSEPVRKARQLERQRLPVHVHRDIYPVHPRSRKSFGDITRKLSVIALLYLAQFRGTFSRRNSRAVSAN